MSPASTAGSQPQSCASQQQLDQLHEPLQQAQQQVQDPGHEQQQQQQQEEEEEEQLPAPVLRRIAVLECEDAERWRGYTESLWKAALFEKGDEWTMYEVCKGHLPSPSEAAGFDAILVSGSHYSIYEEHDWIRQLLDLLPQYAATGTRIYGCCFGCQALAQALGGSVGPNPDGKFVLTIEQVTPTQQLSQFKQLDAVLQQALQSTASVASPAIDAPAADRQAAAAQAVAAVAAAGEHEQERCGRCCEGVAGGVSNSGSSQDAVVVPVSEQLSACSLKAVEKGSSVVMDAKAASSTIDGAGCDKGSNSCAGGCFRLIESHGDQVLTLPPGAVVLASSPTAPYELWSWGDNVLASQFHLEFDEPLVVDKIWTRMTDVGRLDSQQSVQSKRVLEAGGQHNVQMLQVVKHFLRHGIH